MSKWMYPAKWRDFEVFQKYAGGTIIGVDRAKKRLLVEFA